MYVLGANDKGFFCGFEGLVEEAHGEANLCQGMPGGKRLRIKADGLPELLQGSFVVAQGKFEGGFLHHNLNRFPTHGFFGFGKIEWSLCSWGQLKFFQFVLYLEIQQFFVEI